MLNSTAATSHSFGKLLERQSTTRLSRYICQCFRVSFPCQALSRLSLALHRHRATLLGALDSLNSLESDVLQVRQRLQHRVEQVIDMIVHTTDPPIGEDCDLFPALWSLLDRDGEEFIGSVRNLAAFHAFCPRLADLGRQLRDDGVSIHALRNVSAAFALTQVANFYPNIHPSFSAALIKRVEMLVRLRAAGRWGNAAGQLTVGAG